MAETPTRYAKPGFTLIELLVVISIIALLIALLLPALGDTRDQARTTACMSNARQISLPVQMYISDHRRMPAGTDYPWLLFVTGGYISHPLGDTATILDPIERKPQALGIFACPSEQEPKALMWPSWYGTTYGLNRYIAPHDSWIQNTPWEVHGLDEYRDLSNVVLWADAGDHLTGSKPHDLQESAIRYRHRRDLVMAVCSFVDGHAKRVIDRFSGILPQEQSSPYVLVWEPNRPPPWAN